MTGKVLGSASKSKLNKLIREIDGKGYKAYKSLEGVYEFEDFTLYIDHVQSDPFAPPSRLRARVSMNMSGIPDDLFNTKTRRIAMEDFLTRTFKYTVDTLAKGKRGTGKGGLISIARCGQEILERSSMVLNQMYVEARFTVGLPAAGRRVLGQQAEEIFFNELEQIIKKALFWCNLNQQKAYEHVKTMEDQVFLRQALLELNLVSFVADGSILPRESGVSERPLRRGNIVPFQSPEQLRLTINLPNRGPVTGMGIPKGISLIVGGGYHGKSTLLKAVERGVYNHIPGDGREYVVTVEDAVKIRAEDGRSVVKVDISGFINNLPFGRDTTEFSTENASGSTSQAANIVEALEVGTHLLLLDEDTSATNFMIRDGRMQQLVAKEYEPITPFIDRVRQLLKNMDVSTIVVVGGSGDYFEVADLVIKMENYIPHDVTSRAKEIFENSKFNRKVEAAGDLKKINKRVILNSSLKLGSREKVKGRDLHNISYGRQDIDLSYVEQLVDPGQTRAVADIMRYAAEKYVDNERDLSSVIRSVFKDIKEKGLDVISPFQGQHPGSYAMPRKYEVAAAFNRFRRLMIKHI